jgi:hypothetical protein
VNDDGLTDDLCSLMVVAEDIRDGRRTEPFTHDEVVRLCDGLGRVIALLSDEDRE